MTYQEMISFETLYNAFLEARKKKRSKPATAQYEANVLDYTQRLSLLLQAGKYRPGKFEVFYVCEPKKRLVQAPAFTDKVVLHAAVDNILYEAITHSFIRDNYASQIDKGTHDGLLRMKQAMNRYCRKHGSADGWVLKGDVRHFFASIDHDRLKERLLRLFHDKSLPLELYDLLCIYIDTTQGLPLGYQTSQLFALLYLDGFDHFIKEQLHAKSYGRYMDDFYEIAETKEELQEHLRLMKGWLSDLGLELNEKTAIFPLRNGIDFLGFHTYVTDTGKVIQKLRRSSVQRIKGKVKYWRRAYPAGEVEKDDIKASWQAWDAHASHGDTYALRAKIAAQVGEIIGEKLQPARKVTSSKKVKGIRRAKHSTQAAGRATAEKPESTKQGG